MKTLVATAIALASITASSNAALLLYDPFDYPSGDSLGGSDTSPLGKIAPNGKQWITRSPANGGTYTPGRDVAIVSGNLSYPGLAPSVGNSVRYGTNDVVASTTNAFYTDAIDLPGDPFLDGSVYYSMIVRFNSGIPAGGVRTSYASFSYEGADPAAEAGYGLTTSSGSTARLPASLWIRNAAGNYHLGAGKQNTDGLGTTASAPSWQAVGTPYPNQQGNTTGNGQAWETISNNVYFVVVKYTFVPGTANDTVSMWVNPIASTLGHNPGEGLASEAGGSYYSATNATVTVDYDSVLGIQSFILIGNAQASSRVDKSIDVSVDELRIGTEWADVTPAAPLTPTITHITGAGTTSVTVHWDNAVSGASYVLQYRSDLGTGVWNDLPPVVASGPTALQTDNPPAGAPARFYRVKKL